jgi:hypothetical protein
MIGVATVHLVAIDAKPARIASFLENNAQLAQNIDNPFPNRRFSVTPPLEVQIPPLVCRKPLFFDLRT